ncbi:MAG: ATP-binding protein [Ferruginibacter sp.]
MIKKIVILGPESTGKSTLCKQLSHHFGSPWVKEYAREYLEKNSTGYNFNDLLDIAKGQLSLEDKAIYNAAAMLQPESPGNGSIPLFIDTNMYVLKVWCEFVFGKCHQWITQQILERKYDLYLLCDVDLPWVKDDLREYPDLETREKLYHLYKDIMVNQEVPWVNINGDYEERLRKGIEAVDKILW